MTGIVIAIIAGSLSGVWIPWPWSWLAAFVAIPGVVRLMPVRLLAVMVTMIWANHQLESILQARIEAPIEIEVRLRVSGIPRVAERSVGFLAAPNASDYFYSLRWYDPDFPLESGDILTATVRLNPVRGTFNRRGFDFEAWATGERIIATGFIKTASRQHSEAGLIDRIHHTRSRISTRLKQTFEGPAGRLYPALAVADRQYLTGEDRAVLAATGTAHLLAISGLHIGLMAGVGFLVSRLLWNLWLPRLPRPVFSVGLGLAFAVGYAALAGFSVSTQRALIMLVVSGLIIVLRRPLRPGVTLLAAAAAVLIVDPVASISAGFWLSFGAVGVLVLLAVLAPGWKGRGRIQLALSLGMAPLTLVFGFRLALVSPVANLAAIPWVGAVVVPLLFCWLLLDALNPGAGAWAAAMCAWPLEWLYGLLRMLARVSGDTVLPLRHPSAALLALGFLALIAPGGLRLRAPACLLIALAVAFARPQRAPGEVVVHVIDVGQGQAVLVETRNHVLLYDTGPGSASGWEAGSSIVVPYLQSLGLGAVDRTIVSHGDSDHSAGLRGMRAMDVDVGDVLSSDRRFGEPCLQGQSWTWDAVRFSILHPGPGLPYLGNDSSCVLRIDSEELSILIPGDVSSVVESRLARTTAPVDILIAAHHGSTSSSSTSFLNALDPRIVVFSRGAYNRFGMPRQEVLQRMTDRQIADTAQCGGLILTAAPSGQILLRHARDRQRRWHAAPLTDISPCGTFSEQRGETSAEKNSMIPARLLSNP